MLLAGRGGRAWLGWGCKRLRKAGEQHPVGWVSVRGKLGSPARLDLGQELACPRWGFLVTPNDWASESCLPLLRVLGHRRFPSP